MAFAHKGHDSVLDHASYHDVGVEVVGERNEDTVALRQHGKEYTEDHDYLHHGGYQVPQVHKKLHFGATAEGPSEDEVLNHLSSGAAVLEEHETGLQKIFDKMSTHDNVLDKGAYLGFCRKCALSPQLLSRAEMMEIYKTTHFDEAEKMQQDVLHRDTKPGAKGDCLTFYGFVEALRRAAGILFSGSEWDERYPTEADKVRLLLFWIEQGETNEGWGGGAKEKRAARASEMRIPSSIKPPNKLPKRKSLFPGNSELLMKHRSHKRMSSVHFEDGEERARAATRAFGVPDIRFSVAAFDVGGIVTRLPQLLPHIESVDLELKRLFVWYSGAPEDLPAGNEGDCLEMSAARFYKFVRDCRLLRGAITRGIVDVVFKKVTVAMVGTTLGKDAGTSAIDGVPEWKSNSFNYKTPSNSMINRRMTYENFYIALADLATRKYATNTSASGHKIYQAYAHRPVSVGPAFHKLLLKDVLPMFARFWEKASKKQNGGTAILIGSPVSMENAIRVNRAAGGSPEKRADSWRRRWVQVHRLEDELRRKDVVRAFHLQTKDIVDLVGAPSVTHAHHSHEHLPSAQKRRIRMYRSAKTAEGAEAMKVTDARPLLQTSPRHQSHESPMQSTRRSINTLLEETSVAGTYLSEKAPELDSRDKTVSSHLPAPPPALATPSSSSRRREHTRSILYTEVDATSGIASSARIREGDDLSNILNSVRAKINSLQRTIGDASENKLVATTRSIASGSSTGRSKTSVEFRSIADSSKMTQATPPPPPPAPPQLLLPADISKGKATPPPPPPRQLVSPMGKNEMQVDELTTSTVPNPQTKSARVLEVSGTREKTTGSPKRAIVMTSPEQNTDGAASAVFQGGRATSMYLPLFNVRLQTRLLILAEAPSEGMSRGKNRLRSRVENEFCGTLDVHLLGLRNKKKKSSLDSLRVILTSEDDVYFHFRHYTSRELFEGVRENQGFDVGFDKYPEALMAVFNGSSAKDVAVTFQCRRDGKALLRITRALYGGAKKIEVLRLNFTRSPKSIVDEHVAAQKARLRKKGGRSGRM